MDFRFVTITRNLILILLIIICLNYCCCKKYYNYRLYRAVPVNTTHLEFFITLSDRYDVNFWRPPGSVYRPVEFIIGPDQQPSVLREANKYGIDLTTIMEDVQKAFDMQTVKNYIRRKMDSFDWRDYFRLHDIYQWLKDLNSAFPREVQLKTIGKTFENRDILAVEIKLENCISRSKVIVEGGIHAREWISPAFVTYLTSQIVYADQSADKAWKTIANTYEWYIVPVLNPDGYEHTHTQDRLWRKNRNNGDRGVDLNRNFDAGFGTVGVSRQEKSEIYCGTKPFSENESLAMSNFIRSHSDGLEYYLSFHSYGQYMIIPYAHSNEHKDNYDEMKKICNGAASHIANRYNTKYISGTAYDTVGYMTSGVSGCWVKKTFNVPYVVTFELRDSGQYGFALPPEMILPTCKETMDGVISMLTPRAEKYTKLHFNYTFSGQTLKFLDKIVIVLNVCLIILVYFD